MRAKAEIAGQLKAARKFKAPAAEIATLAGVSKRLTVEIKYAKTAGLDPRRARIRLLQVHAGGEHILVIDLNKTGAGVLDLLEGARVIAHNIAFDLSFLEPAAGRGHLSFELRRAGLKVASFDLHRCANPLVPDIEKGDIRPLTTLAGFARVVTNQPYSDLEELATHLIDLGVRDHSNACQDGGDGGGVADQVLLHHWNQIVHGARVSRRKAVCGGFPIAVYFSGRR
jgi:hypothetical protein